MCRDCVITSSKKHYKNHKTSVFILKMLLSLIGFYRRYISPNLSARCRYYPTCSMYAHQALLWHGVPKGLFLTIKRLLRCQPWGGSGVDFVPVPMGRYFYQQAVFGYCLPYQDAFSYRLRLTYLIKATASV